MIGHISLAEKVDADFSYALRKALLRRVGARLRRDVASDRLLCFDEVRMFHGAAVGRVYRSIRAVPVEQIGGRSVAVLHSIETSWPTVWAASTS